MEQETLNKINISPYSKIKVCWDDSPINYSKEGKNKIKAYFAKKYGVNRDNINVVYRPVKINEKGETIELNNLGVNNIMDVTYQRALMKEVIARDNISVDFDRIIALDEKVNAELDVDLNVSQHKSWSIKWIMLDNFLSYGESNFLSFGKVKGLTIVNSQPGNQSGKTTLTIDAIKFLLHGSTTKTDKNEQIFNSYTDKNELVVRGMLDIEGDEIIIERKMKRSAKKGGGWNVTNKVNYYKLLPDGEEELLNDDDAKKTTAKIKESIGSENDFELLVLATEKNLDDLIGLTSAESGKILTRLIGLEVLELKEGIVRKMYNEFNGKKKSNNFDVITLTSEIIEHERKVNQCIELETILKNKLEETKSEIIKLNGENDRLLNSKEKIDVTISTLNPSKLQEEIDVLTVKGKSLKTKVEELSVQIDTIGEINFDEDLYHLITKTVSSDMTSKAIKEAEVTRLKTVIKGLIEGGICQSCKRKLDDVDNSKHILTHENNILLLDNEIGELTGKITISNNKIVELNKTKTQIDKKNRLELDKDRTEVEIGSLRNKVIGKMNDLKKYTLNLEAIELNKKIDIEVSKIKTNIAVCEFTKDDTITKIERVGSDMILNKKDIKTKTDLIELIKKEEDIDRVFKIYIDLVGKKGVNKLVLRSVLPIINSEVQRLLEDVCDFEIEIFIDDKNEVQFLINKDDVSKPLKSGSGFEKTVSSLALRGVLGKVSTLPMPNFISFDEVLGKVTSENIERIKPLFDKIKNMYEIVFLITHNDLIKDYGDNIITIIKENNISKICLK